MGMATNLLKPRWSVAIVLLILATAGLVGSVMARWTHDVALDTDSWMEVVGPIGTSEVVTDALSGRFSQELIDWIDAEERIGALLPPILEPLAPEIGDFVEELIVSETVRFFGSSVYERAWLFVNENAHPAAVAILRDEVPFGSTAQGVVTVDFVPVLTPIVDAVFDRLDELIDWVPALVRDQVDMFETIDTIIGTYRAEGLPQWLGGIEVFRSDRLAGLQETVATLDRLVWVLPVVTLLLVAGAVYFAPRKWVMGAIMAGAAAVGFVVARLLVAAMVNSVVSDIQSTAGANVAIEIFDGLTGGLNELLVILAVMAGLAAAIVGGWVYFGTERGEDTEEEVDEAVDVD